MIEWIDKYKTGIELIDKQHKELFRLFNRIYELYNNEFIIDKYDQIITAIEELKSYTKYHFEAEEEYMVSIRYKKFFQHKLKHEELINKIDSIDYNIIDEDQQNHLLELMKFLTEWLVQHVLIEDKQYVSIG